ncbi:hypothetical protein EDI_127210 [Entamoeba dispar SAW760]|uniref:Nucleosome assembly protein n=1 Tax=Entamoeba dispar (strain ATCC PRA-260 / SAW760) TaxID=370354 RepID=B0E8L2_ENTDS|nr:uncharacterized protein EDI_127210 [Entamoeba dispar SAW760]EDR29155.1 hypothetical protein EDI_127210 [Entamoeba dispar SAW760]|eukprot:EDR29155.1 hypothetical protein EDI_127210 [Entamoeba dispar SAW760]
MEIIGQEPSKELINVETFDDYLMMTSSQVHKNIYALQTIQTEFRKQRLHGFEKIYNIERKLRANSEPLRKRTVELIKKIPCFWGRIMNVADLNYNNLGDANAIRYLTEVIVEDMPLTICFLGDNKTPALSVLHRVRFIFQPNQLMKTTEAVKIISYKVCGWNNPEMEMLEPEVETEIPIVWMPGKDPRVSRPFKKRNRIEGIASQQQKVIPSFFHLFDDLKHEEEDGEYSQVIEKQKEEDRKMQFKILMGFVNEFVDQAISYFDESIPNRAHPEDYFDDLDGIEEDTDEEFLERMEEEEIPDHLQNPPDCNAQ